MAANRQLQGTRDTAAGVNGAERLLLLLRNQRQAMLRADPAAIAELESGTRQIEQALAALAPGAQQAPVRLAIDAATLARLQGEIQAHRATLASLAAANRRALNALFGEPSLYSK